MNTLPRRPRRIELVPGCSVDAATVLDVATSSNLAHRALGTRLVEVVGTTVSIGVEWRAQLAGRSGGVAPGVVTELLDHAGALAALVSLTDGRHYSGTLSLHLERLAPTRPAAAVCATATCEHLARRTAHVDLVASHLDGEMLAIGSCIVAVRGGPAG